jgi:cell division protein FtsQ
MARKSGSTIVQEELYPSSAEYSRSDSLREKSPREFSRYDSDHDSSRDTIDDARLVDLDIDEQSPFLRAQKRVPARRSSIPKKAASRLLWALTASAILFAGALLTGTLYHYGERSWRFRVESSDNIEVTGLDNATKTQIMEVMGADIGRNIFFVPLAQQKAQLEQIPWVESASVMRFVPNRLKVEIHERTPVAFARLGPRIELIDAGGTLMDLPKASLPHPHKYSFPVIIGMNPGEPLSTRAPRMKAYDELIRALDAGGAHYSQDLSEVDLSDLDDLKVRVNDPAGDVLVELGSSDYLKRYKIYVSHVQEWRQQFQKLESVNLRYDNQVIVNPDMEGKPKQAAITAASARAATAAGVKPAALIAHMNPQDRTVPKPAFELSDQELTQKKLKPVTKEPAAKIRAKKSGHKTAAAKKQLARPGATKSSPKTQAASSTPANKAVHAAATIPKPSPAIARQQTNTSSNN